MFNLLRCVVEGIQYGDRHKILRTGYVDFLYLATFLLCREKEHRHLPGRGDGDAFWIIFLVVLFHFNAHHVVFLVVFNDENLAVFVHFLCF